MAGAHRHYPACLTPEEGAAYANWRRRMRYRGIVPTRNDAMIAIGRPDLVEPGSGVVAVTPDIAPTAENVAKLRGVRPTVMTPDKVSAALVQRRQNANITDAAKAIGVSVHALARWAKKNGIKFKDGRSDRGARNPAQYATPAFKAAARRNAAKGAAVAAVKLRMPLNDEERRRYRAHYHKLRSAGVQADRAEIYRAIGRADLAEAAQ